nr:hypothetical protein [Tanacetum cinerariifolium]
MNVLLQLSITGAYLSSYMMKTSSPCLQEIPPTFENVSPHMESLKKPAFRMSVPQVHDSEVLVDTAPVQGMHQL